MDKLRAAALKNVDITGGFWLDRDDLNRRVTIYSVYNRFSETGRFDALRLMWRQGMDKKPHIFWDSDVAKWIEAAAYIIEKHGDERLEKLCDEMIDRVADRPRTDISTHIFNSLSRLHVLPAVLIMSFIVADTLLRRLLRILMPPVRESF